MISWRFLCHVTVFLFGPCPLWAVPHRVFLPEGVAHPRFAHGLLKPIGKPSQADRDTVGRPSGHRRVSIGTPWLAPSKRNRETIRTPKRRRRDTIANQLQHRRDAIGTPLKEHLETIGTSSQINRDIIGTPSGHHRRRTVTPPGHHQLSIGKLPGHHQNTIGTPRGQPAGPARRSGKRNTFPAIYLNEHQLRHFPVGVAQRSSQIPNLACL